MRIIGLFAGVVLASGAAVLAWSTLVSPPPAAARLSGVTVAVTGHTVEEIRGGHRLSLWVNVDSVRDLDECLAFALDQPFASRLLTPQQRTCVRPRAGRVAVTLVLDRLTDDDLAFPSHTLVWGIEGGRCGIVLRVTGVCVVETVGTARVELPPRTVLPTIGPFVPLFTFAPGAYSP